MLEEHEVGRARGVALLDRPYRDRRRARLHRLPLSRTRLAQRASAPRQVAREFRGTAVRQGERAGGRAMIHSHSIGDARAVGVIEYSGPTHDPAFLYPDDRQGRARRRAQGQCELARAEPLRAAHGPADRHDPALGAACGRQRDRDRHRRRQPQAAPARADGPAQHADLAVARGRRRRARQGHACGDDPSAHRPRRLEHGRAGRQMGADLSQCAIPHSPRGIRLLEGRLRQGRQTGAGRVVRRQRAADRSMRGWPTSSTAPRKSRAASRPSRCRDTRPA